MNLTDLPHIPIMQKKPAKRRDTPANILNNTIQSLKDPTINISKHSQVYKYKAVLRTTNTATFITDDDPLEKLLKTKADAHKKFLDDGIIDIATYKQPYTASGFKFTAGPLVYYNTRGQYCTPDELIDKKCLFKFRIIPYDFVSDETKKRIVGLSIKVLEVLCI